MLKIFTSKKQQNKTITLYKYASTTQGTLQCNDNKNLILYIIIVKKMLIKQ